MKLQLNPSPKNVRLIQIISLVIPLAVATILGMRTKIELGEWTKIFPTINALINSATAILLVVGVAAIRNKNRKLHETCMKGAFILGSLFLVFYIIYHISNHETHFGGEGTIRYAYFFILISHILLSIGVVPFVLMAIYYALCGQFTQHKRIVKWTYPIWLYVSVSGVIAFLMIKPYY